MNSMEFGPIIKFDYFCDTVEDVLTIGAVAPFIGTIPAVIKVAFGTVQLITALAFGILTLPLRCFHDNLASFNDHAWSHICHGAGNIVCGLLQAIPLFGSCLSLERILTAGLNNKTMNYDDVNTYFGSCRQN